MDTPDAQSKKVRLRAPEAEAPFSVVLVEPEIPPNTGNIARLCAATRCPLYLVGKLGFRIDEHAVRRAGLDYWHLVDVRARADLESVEREAGDSPRGPGRSWLLSASASTSYLDVCFARGDRLVFGKESVGLAPELLTERAADVIGIPTLGAVRSLNLANAVAITLYEALRQVGALTVAASRQ